MDGRKFEDGSYSGGVQNIQKGHGVSFLDWNQDSIWDEDIFQVIGGADDGDAFYNSFFENPNQDDNLLISLIIGEDPKVNIQRAISGRDTVSFIENGKGTIDP